MSSMTSHTPGPWHYFNSGPGLIRDATGKPIAALKSISRPGHRKAADLDEEVSNAALIAAAPDLLKALEQMNHTYGDGYCICPLNDGNAPDSEHATSCADARLAIQKARGE